jgi:N6-L-threonylcarbamoyladenine synthase
VDVLVAKTLRAARVSAVRLVTLSGGVSCNGELRRELQSACRREELKFRAASPGLCTDNAAMIAFAASHRFEAGLVSEVSDEIDPNLPLA